MPLGEVPRQLVAGYDWPGPCSGCRVVIGPRLLRRYPLGLVHQAAAVYQQVVKPNATYGGMPSLFCRRGARARNSSTLRSVQIRETQVRTVDVCRTCDTGSFVVGSSTKVAKRAHGHGLKSEKLVDQLLPRKSVAWDAFESTG